MAIENNEHNEQSSNPFTASSKKIDAELNQWGLDEFENIWDKHRVRMKAVERINAENVTDESEKRKVYDEIKEQYKEYLAYSVRSEATHKKADDTTKQPMEDEEAEYQRGYERCFQNEKEQEEKDLTPFRRGWRAALRVIEKAPQTVMQALGG